VAAFEDKSALALHRAVDAPLFTIRRLNDAFLKKFSCTREQFVGRVLFDAFRGASSASSTASEVAVGTLFRRVLQSGQAEIVIYSGDQVPPRFREEDPKGHWIFSSFPINNAQGIMEGLLLTIGMVEMLTVVEPKDVIDDKWLEEDAKGANEQLEWQRRAKEGLRHSNDDLLALVRQADETSRQKAEYLVNLSHELRTPLNAVIGFSKLLQDDSADLGKTRWEDVPFPLTFGDSGVYA